MRHSSGNFFCKNVTFFLKKKIKKSQFLPIFIKKKVVQKNNYKRILSLFIKKNK